MCEIELLHYKEARGNNLPSTLQWKSTADSEPWVSRAAGLRLRAQCLRLRSTWIGQTEKAGRLSNLMLGA